MRKMANDDHGQRLLPLYAVIDGVWRFKRDRLGSESMMQDSKRFRRGARAIDNGRGIYIQGCLLSHKHRRCLCYGYERKCIRLTQVPV
jgi:hypothetical protein